MATEEKQQRNGIESSSELPEGEDIREFSEEESRPHSGETGRPNKKPVKVARSGMVTGSRSGMSLKTKIVGSLVILLLFLAAITALSWHYLNDLAKNYITKINLTSTKLGDIDAKLARIAEQIRADILTGRQFEKNFVIMEEEAAVKQLDAIISKVREASKQGESLAKEGKIVGAEAIFADVNESVDNYERTFRETEKNIKSARTRISDNEKRIANARQELINIITKNIEATRSLAADYWIATKAEAEARMKERKVTTPTRDASITPAAPEKVEKEKQEITVSELVDIGRELEGLDKEQLQVRVNLERYIATRHNSDAEAARANLAQVQQIAVNARTLSNAITDLKLKEEVQLQLDEVKKTASEFSRRVEQVIADNVKNAAEITTLQSTINKNVSQLDAAGQAIKTLAEKELIDLQWKTINSEAETSKTDGEAALRAADTASTTVLIIGIIASVIALGITILMPRPIARAITDLLVGSSFIAEGDLTQELSVRSGDELGQLGDMFNTMRQYLYTLAERLQNASIQITSTTNEILASSEQQSRSSTEQANQVNELGSALTEISVSAEEMVKTAVSVQEQITQTSENSNDAVNAVQETIQGIERINVSNNTASEKINILNEKIDAIGEVMTTITGVADQTNLLSLNAAIEASKAGEQGKGFAVVANEIRRLADQTVIASQDIGNMIREVQTAANSAVMSMQTCGQDIKSGTSSVSNASDVLNTSNSGIQNLVPQIQQVSQSANQQTGGTKQTVESVEMMRVATSQVKDAAEQAKTSASELNVMAGQLRQAVQQFKLR